MLIQLFCRSSLYLAGSGINQVVSVAEHQVELRLLALQLALVLRHLKDLTICFKEIMDKIDVGCYESEVLRDENYLLGFNFAAPLCVEPEICDRQRLLKMLGVTYEDVSSTLFSGVSVHSVVVSLNVFF